MYLLENIDTGEKCRFNNRFEAARKAGVIADYIEVLARTGKVTRKGWAVTKEK